MTKIKICGITNLKDALLASETGADAVGFIFAKSPRQISPERAREITVHLPSFIWKVGVFRDEKISSVKEIMDRCLLDMVQFHGKEDESYISVFGYKAIKVFEIENREVLSEIRKFSLPFFMLDVTKKNERARLNWKIAQEAKKTGRVILAGRLTPENIKHALEKVSPYGVDVCRGVESEYGVKSPEKLKEFILRVRKWDIRRV